MTDDRYGKYEQVNGETVNRCRDEITRLRVAMAKAAQRAEDWPDSNDDPADVLADCVNILYAAMDGK